MSFLRDLPPTALISLIACTALLIVVLASIPVRARARKKAPDTAPSQSPSTEATAVEEEGSVETIPPPPQRAAQEQSAAGDALGEATTMTDTAVPPEHADHSGDTEDIALSDAPVAAPVDAPRNDSDNYTFTDDPSDPPQPVFAHAPAALDSDAEDDPYVTAALDAHGSVVEPGWPSPGELASGFNPDVFDPLPPDSGLEFEDDDGVPTSEAAAVEYDDTDDEDIDFSDEIESDDDDEDEYDDDIDDDIEYSHDEDLSDDEDRDADAISELDTTQVLDTSDVDWDDDGFDPATGWATDDDEIHVSVTADTAAADSLDVELDPEDDLDIDAILSLAEDDLDLGHDDDFDDDVNLLLTDDPSAEDRFPVSESGVAPAEPYGPSAEQQQIEDTLDEPAQDEILTQDAPHAADAHDDEPAWDHADVTATESSRDDALSVPYPAPGTLPAHHALGDGPISTPMTFEGLHSEPGEMTAHLAFGGHSPIVVDLGPLVALRGSVDVRIERDAHSGGLRVVVDPESSAATPGGEQDTSPVVHAEADEASESQARGEVALAPWDESDSDPAQDMTAGDASTATVVPGTNDGPSAQPARDDGSSEPSVPLVSVDETEPQMSDAVADGDTPWQTPDAEDASDDRDGAFSEDGHALSTPDESIPMSMDGRHSTDEAHTHEHPVESTPSPDVHSVEAVAHPSDDRASAADGADDYEDPAQILAEIRDRLAAIDERRLSSHSPH